MSKLEKIWTIILLSVVIFEMVTLIALSVATVIRSGDRSCCIVWVFVPGLVVAARIFYGYLKGRYDEDS